MIKNDNELLVRDDGGFDFFGPIFRDLWDMPTLKHEFREMEHSMKTDIKENENGYKLEVEMPGYDKSNINMNLENGYLTISAQKTENKDQTDKKGNYIRRERKFGSCSRSFYVGDNIKEEDIDAKLEQGVLVINVPKTNPKIENKKQILIK